MFKFISYCYRIWTVCLSNAASSTVCSASCSLDPEHCMQGIAICISISKGTAKVQWHTACSLLKSDIISTISTIPAPPYISILSVSPQNNSPPHHSRRLSVALTERIKHNEVSLLYLRPKTISSHLMSVPSRSSQHLKTEQYLQCSVSVVQKGIKYLWLLSLQPSISPKKTLSKTLLQITGAISHVRSTWLLFKVIPATRYVRSFWLK